MTKLPGIPVRGSQTGRPIMVLLDILGQRWCLRVLWELRDGPMTFRALQAKCENVSPTSLNKRLKELRDVQIVELIAEGYCLTRQGKELGKLLMSLQEWSEKWANDI